MTKKKAFSNIFITNGLKQMMAFMTKILNFYKKIKFRFKHLFYTLESLVVVLFVVIIIGIANSNGYQNFKESFTARRNNFLIN